MNALAVNDQVQAERVKLIDNGGSHLGIFSVNKALNMAVNSDLDLVEIQKLANDSMSICKLMDYGKYKYEQQKEERKKRKNEKLKEVQLNGNIDDHDLDIKIKNIRRMIERKNRVKVTVRSHKKGSGCLDVKIVGTIYGELKDIIKKEKEERIEGNLVTYFIRK